MRMDGVTLVAVILVGSFAIERITNAALFLLSLLKPVRRIFPDPAPLADPAERAAAEKKKTLLYFAIAGVLGLGVLAGYGNLRVLRAVGVETNAYFDAILTGLILVGGADRVAELLKLPGSRGGEKPAERPIQITGTLVLEEGTGRKA